MLGACRLWLSRMIPSAKKAGFAAALFFTIKGLLWLIVPFLLYTWGC